jgi:hypothetical protein
MIIIRHAECLFHAFIFNMEGFGIYLMIESVNWASVASEIGFTKRHIWVYWD